MKAEAIKNYDYTVEDIYALPEGERAELIDGKIYFMGSPSTRHQELLVELLYQIKNYIKSKSGNCKVFVAPFAVFLSEDNKNYVEPDIVVICDKNKIDKKGCNGAPDWIIEIVSPSSQTMDYLVKQYKYRDAGVREYWIVDPSDEKINIYNFEKEEYSKYSFDDEAVSGIYEDLTIRLN